MLHPLPRFETVSDLLAMKGTLPRVIRATRTFTSPLPDASVSQDELLILKQTKKSGEWLSSYDHSPSVGVCVGVCVCVGECSTASQCMYLLQVNS